MPRTLSFIELLRGNAVLCSVRLGEVLSVDGEWHLVQLGEKTLAAIPEVPEKVVVTLAAACAGDIEKTGVNTEIKTIR